MTINLSNAEPGEMYIRRDGTEVEYIGKSILHDDKYIYVFSHPNDKLHWHQRDGVTSSSSINGEKDVARKKKNSKFVFEH